MILTAIFLFGLICAFFAKIYEHRKSVSQLAEKKWEEEDLTVYVRYGKYDIPMLASQVKVWEKMDDNQKWWMLDNLKSEVKAGRLTIEKMDGITKFAGITPKAKDIKFRQKNRTEAWKS